MKPNFRSFEQTPPPWPAFSCLDGWAWHPKKELRHCHKGNAPYPAETLARVYQGEAIERVLALREILLSSGSQHHALLRVFPECPQCTPTAKTKRRLAQSRLIWRRAAMAIHEGAIPTLREACPALDRLWNVAIAESRRKPDHSKRYDYLMARGIPVKDPNWNRRRPPEDEATRVAQVFWALEIMNEDWEDEAS